MLLGINKIGLSLLCQLVQHPLFVLDLVPEAAELLLMSIPVVLQLLLHCVLEDRDTQSCDSCKINTANRFTCSHLDVVIPVQSSDVRLLLLPPQLVSLL